MTDPRHALGREAEEAVARWLTGEGWELLARRWRVAEGELDLVLRDPSGALVAVEVRARRSGRTGTALESLDAGHLRRLRSALARYARERHVAHAPLRIDLVTLTPAPDRDPPGEAWRATRHPAVDAW
ncbi:MAG TPA: YraN family protein [Candidatus Limnocylindria bacterium]|jgi:putative endonuclease|nr:YraN family protein [Candidatus Limnocylindria bacterium]